MKTPYDFSFFNRPHFLGAMASRELDLLVIGGGITGAGIALDSTSRGLRVGLIEKQDFASGTSSRSTKLIHGGLRYLKQLEFGLVREVGRERAILYKNAPHLVRPEKMLLPIVRKGSYGWWAASFGTWLYDRLAGVRKEERRKMLSREELIQLEPLLKEESVLGGALFYEYRTDDARLTIEVIKTAYSQGALCVNYAEASAFIIEQGRVRGAKVRDTLTAKTYDIRAKKVVNAAGPWVDVIRKMDGPVRGKRLRLTKGVHIVVPRNQFPLKESVYFDAGDGRMIFSIPRGDAVYIGTTDTDYAGPIENPPVSDVDIAYLLNAVNDCFKSVRLSKEDVKSSWAGVRPLIQEEGKNPSEVSRKDEIFISPSGLISIAGGKLTGYRIMAERVVDLIMRQLSREEKIPNVKSGTQSIPLSGGDLGTSFDEFCARKIAEYSRLGLEDKTIRNLCLKYGNNIGAALDGLEGGSPIDVAQAELHYCLRHEMVTDLNDFLIRRTGRTYFEWNAAQEFFAPLTAKLSALLS